MLTNVPTRRAVSALQRAGVRFERLTTISLGTGNGTIAHLAAGAAARRGVVRQTLVGYPMSERS